jgi:MFS family permease
MSEQSAKKIKSPKKFAIDIEPLKKYPDFRYLWSSGFITYLGNMITYVAVPFQVKEITNSYVAVAISGVIEIVPLIIFGLYGGALADAVDRKKMIWISEFTSALLVLTLFVNSLQEKPNLPLIYIVIGLFAAVSGLQTPSLDAALPRLVSHKDLPAATALMSIRRQVGVIVGPTIGGILISSFSVSTGYAVDLFTFVLSILLLSRIRKIPPTHDAQKPSLAALLDGLRYALSRKDLLGTYLVDLAAMFFAMPIALFPFWADQLGAPWSLGLLYAAGTVGALVVTLTSGWTAHYRFHGKAILYAAIGWGVAISLAGATNWLWVVLFFLTVAGAADMVSVLFRSNIWNQSIPDNFRGRLAGLEMLSYSIGPMAGQLRAASMAAATSLTFSVTIGGVLCVIAVLILASFYPEFRKYDVQTNKFAVEMRKIRESREKSGEN